jgi:hypothetical protein
MVLASKAISVTPPTGLKQISITDRYQGSLAFTLQTSTTFIKV